MKKNKTTDFTFGGRKEMNLLDKFVQDWQNKAKKQMEFMITSGAYSKKRFKSLAEKYIEYDEEE